MPSNVEPEAIRFQLERILATRSFRQAPRVSELLRHLVEQSQCGNERDLKEIAIGLAVFRDPEYDPSKNASVRATATRLRKKLTAYYRTEGADDELLISLPDEGYV